MQGGEVSIPLDGMDEPRLRRGGGVRDQVFPETRSSSKAICSRARARAAESRRRRARRDSEDAFRFVLTREEFLDLFLDDLELPDLAKRRLAEAEHSGIRRAGYAVSGSPANIAVGRTMRIAMARGSMRRPRPETIEQLEREIDDCDEERGAALRAQVEALKAKFRRIPYIDPIDIRYRRFETSPSRWPRRSCSA